MAGRGRGRGGQFSAISDGLGLARGGPELGANTAVEPPPIYPKLHCKPRYPLMLPEHDYMLAVMKDFTTHMRDSQYAISSDKKSLNQGVVIEKISGKVQVSPELILSLSEVIYIYFQGHVQKPLVGIDWKRYPKELMPSSKAAKTKRKSSVKPNINKAAKKVKAVDDVLDKLEKAETKEKAGDDDEDKSNDEDSDKDERESVAGNDDVEDDENMDEELDEGTDYANNYFDNGENYLDDEDDNLDEGGIY